MAEPWYYSKQGQRVGPVSEEQLKQLASSGQVQPTDLVWKKGMAQWAQARKVKGLFPTAPAAHPPSAAPVPMADQWYYSMQGQRMGPVSEEQLKHMAASGQVQPTDLVWKKGMAQWTQARMVKGLFPTAPEANPPLTPFAPPSSGEAPAMWNPKWLGAWSLLFSWAFGAFLLAGNWKALGEPDKAKRAMMWFYALFPFLLLCALVPNMPILAGVAILAAFYWIEVNPQINLVKARFSDQYPRKSWLKPVAIGGVTAVVALAIVANLGEYSRGTLPPSSTSNDSSDGSTTSASSSGGHRINDEFQLGDYKYRITRVGQQPLVGNQFMAKRASAGAVFVIVSYTIENCTNKTQTVLSEDFTLVDRKGREFRPSSDVNTALLTEGDKDFLLSELQPGVPRRMIVGFEVPDSIPLSDLTLVIPKKGLFSSGTVQVRLTDQ